MCAGARYSPEMTRENKPFWDQISPRQDVQQCVERVLRCAIQRSYSFLQTVSASYGGSYSSRGAHSSGMVDTPMMINPSPTFQSFEPLMGSTHKF